MSGHGGSRKEAREQRLAAEARAEGERQQHQAVEKAARKEHKQRQVAEEGRA